MEARPNSPADGVGVLMHVPLTLTIRIGTCRLSVAEVLQLATGSVVELDRSIDHPVELLANERAIARGEIVAVDNRFALRITELLAVVQAP